jgi:hypothetical protein
MNVRLVVVGGVAVVAVAVSWFFSGHGQVDDAPVVPNRKTTTSASIIESASAPVTDEISISNLSSSDNADAQVNKEELPEIKQSSEVKQSDEENTAEPVDDEQEMALYSSRAFASLIDFSLQSQGIELDASQRENLESEFRELKESAYAQDEEMLLSELYGERFQEILEKILTPEQLEIYTASIDDAAE